jgi:hypothetical protein
MTIPTPRATPNFNNMMTMTGKLSMTTAGNQEQIEETLSKSEQLMK